MNELNRNYINGQWVSWAGDMIDVHEAGTGDVIARVPASGADEMEQAIAAADAAFESWSESTLEQRIKVLKQLHAGLKERAPEIAETVCREVGMPIKTGHADPGRYAGCGDQELPETVAGLRVHRAIR